MITSVVTSPLGVVTVIVNGPVPVTENLNKVLLWACAPAAIALEETEKEVALVTVTPGLLP